MPTTRPAAPRTPSPEPRPAAASTAARGLLLIGATCLAAACGGSSEGDGDSRGGRGGEASAPPLVRVEKVGLRTVQRVIDTTSTLESEHRVTIFPEVAGRIVEVHVDEGSEVTEGQEIARLDDRGARAALAQTEVQLEDRKVRLDLQKLEAEAAQSRVESARIERDRTKAELARNESIDPGLISRKQLEEAAFAADAAAEALRVAEFDSRKATLEVRAAEAAIREIEAKVEEARLRVQEHAVLSPIDGVVESISVRGGETVSASTELFRVVDPDDLISFLRRPQRELPMIRAARRVQFTTDAFPGRRFEAEIDLIAPTVDEASGSFRIRIRVRKEDTNALRPGLFVRAEILTEAEREALMVPKSAILNDGRESIVFAVRDGVAKRIVLDRGLEEREYVECVNRGAEGLVPGDLIVVSGQQSLKDDMAVELVDGGDGPADDATDGAPDGSPGGGADGPRGGGTPGAAAALPGGGKDDAAGDGRPDDARSGRKEG